MTQTGHPFSAKENGVIAAKIGANASSVPARLQIGLEINQVPFFPVEVKKCVVSILSMTNPIIPHQH